MCVVYLVVDGFYLVFFLIPIARYFHLGWPTTDD